MAPFRVRRLALQQEGRGAHDTHHADQPGGPAGARKEADHDLGQADLGTRVLGGDAVVAGKAKLEPDSHRGAGRGPDERFAAFVGFRVGACAFNFAQDPVELHDEAENGLGRVAACFQRLGLHPGDDVKVHATGEIGLAGGEDHAPDRVIGQGGVHMGVELTDALLVQHIHRGAGQVPGNGGDAIGGGIGENLGH